MPLIGTAGHVDHGKSTLVQALSGRDPDRWAEEKRRGLTIDLGFAWADIGGGEEVSFVDVPGHERYLKNMLAGIEAIDIALFVVAADEGWMPQSEEHLAVLDLLGVSCGVVALTKTDLVDRDTVELATLEVEESLEGTSLQGARVMPVSATMGSGLAELTEVLLTLTRGITRDDSGSPRLWIDRSFSVAGAGTVVTGSLLEGELHRSDLVQVFPGTVTGRIRSLQSHEKDVEIARPGTRVALGLSRVSREETPRGHMLGHPGSWRATQRFSAALTPARYADQISEKGAYQIHIGSGTHQLHIQRVESGFAVMQTDSLIPMRMGDRFIIRDSGRRLVVAGGQILDPAPGGTAPAIRDAPGFDPDAKPHARAAQLLAARGHDDLLHLRQDSGGGIPDNAVIVGSAAMTSSTIKRLAREAVRLTTADHRDHPLRPGLPLATLATILDVSTDVAERVIGETAELKLKGPDVSHLSHQPTLDTGVSETWATARDRLAQGLDVPTLAELGLSDELLHWLLREDHLVRVSDSIVYLPAQISEIETLIRRLPQPFGISEAKDVLHLSRKYVVPILEWLDSNHITRRRGDLRTVRPGRAVS